MVTAGEKLGAPEHPPHPALCMHKINLEEDAKPVVDYQRRLHPKIKEVVIKEVIRLMEAGIIYPIADSKWVSDASKMHT